MHKQQKPCLNGQTNVYAPRERLRRSLGSTVKGYGTDQVVPGQRQERDVDAEADDGQVAVQQPGQHLERLKGPRPTVHPGRLGEDELGPAAAVQGRRPSLSSTAAAHLECNSGHFNRQRGHIC